MSVGDGGWHDGQLCGEGETGAFHWETSLLGNQCFLFFSSLLASCSPIRQTSAEVSERRHCWNALHTSSESAGSHATCFLHPGKRTRVASNATTTMILCISAPSKRLRNSVVRVRRKKQVLREIHFHAVSLSDRDGGRYLHEAIKDRGGRLRNTARSPGGECLGTASRDGAATLRDLARPGNHTQSYRGTKDLEVVIVDLIFQSFLSDLIQTLELVEIDGVAVWHKQTVKNHGHSPLLAEARRSNLSCLT